MSTNEARPLHLHTIESLCADLISGRAVGLDEDKTFALPTEDSRAILNWYYGRRSRWQARMSEADAEDIADAVGTDPPELGAIQLVQAPTKRRLRLTKLQAHRFGGIQAYGTKDNPPEDFVFVPSANLSLFEGSNGSGKTSLLNAAIWCLTGSLLRAQRPPAEGDDEFDCRIERKSGDGALEEASAHGLTPVTPLPAPGLYAPAVGEAVPIDTWVELTFVDDQGTAHSPIRRTQRRKANGKIDEIPPDLTSLGIDPIAFRIGTVMPAMLQHIQIGSSSDLGRAVSELTGLAELTVLEGHAERAGSYLLKNATKRREGDIETADQTFNVARGDLEKRIEEFPPMKPASALPTPSESDQVEAELATLKDHFDQRKSDALKAAQSILGSSFDPEDETAREDLIENIGPARGELKRLDQMSSAARLLKLSGLSTAEEDDARALIARLRAEAESLAALASDPELAPRAQVYAHLASWMKTYGIVDTSTCHTCVRPAEGVLDPVSKRPFAEHLQEALEGDSELISRTAESWCEARLEKLAGDLPEALSSERLVDLPAHPSSLIRSAIVDELFDTDPFLGSLASLKDAHGALCDAELAGLSDLEEPTQTPLPEEIRSATMPLELALARIDRALAFAEWRRSANAEVEAAIGKITNGNSTPPNADASTAVEGALSAKLSALKEIVDGSAPIRAAIELTERMSDALGKRRTAEARIEVYKKAADGLVHIESVGGLAAAQVDGLQKSLGTKARDWKDKIYQDAVTSYQLQSTTMPADGVLEFQVGSDDITAPAQHVSNASALRASLVGFFFAFRAHVLDTRGGLDLLIFDDPHELLDAHNREKMGMTLVELARTGAQLLVTTYDQKFAQVMVGEGGKENLVAHYSIHPVNARRDRIELSDSKLQVEVKASRFKQQTDDHDTAREYANSVRIYLETRLRDLFDDPTYPAYASGTTKPTFGDHLSHLRGLVGNGINALFKHQLVAGFSSDPRLQSSHECYRLLSDAHHDPTKVTYGRVNAVATDLRALRGGVEKMHQAFRDFRWKNKLPAIDAAPPANDNAPLESLAPPDLNCPIYPDLAAFTASGAGGGSQAAAESVLSGQWFADKALFLIRSNNLGLSIRSGEIAIVETAAAPGRDRNLVIARSAERILARRLLRADDAEYWALAAETPDPRNSPLTLIAKEGEWALHRVVGCLLLDPPYMNAKGEAVQIEGASLLAKIKAAWRVDQESAIPFALPNQILLGGDEIVDYSQHEGAIAAIRLTDGSQLLKRIGAAMPGKLGYIRHFETIGGLGGSVLLQTELMDDSPVDVSVIENARLAIGVIYDL